MISDDLYGLPCFTDQDRHLYFDLNVLERAAVTAVHTAWRYAAPCAPVRPGSPIMSLKDQHLNYDFRTV